MTGREMAEVLNEFAVAARMRQFASGAWQFLMAVPESRMNYWASYITDFSCPIVFAYLGMRHGANWAMSMSSFLSGLAAFSLVEYSIHRWLLHDERSVLFRLHEAHHKNPAKLTAFFFPTSIVILSVAWLLLMRVFHLHTASFFICGFAVGYCYFGVLHHVEHTSRINQLPFRWLQKRWAAHSVHHRLDYRNFGVITSFWDHVFGTQRMQGNRRR